jgi:hypothetical protein
VIMGVPYGVGFADDLMLANLVMATVN